MVRRCSLLAQSISQRTFPQFSLPQFFPPRLWTLLQCREVCIGSVQESLTTITLNCLIQYCLHGLLLFIGYLPEQSVSTRAQSNVGCADGRLHRQSIALSVAICIQVRITICMEFCATRWSAALTHSP